MTSIQWLTSKSNTEFFSGGNDGQVLTWDSRKMQEPIEQLLMDPHRCEEPKMENALGITVLEFEPTIPAKFMVGTAQGVCFSCNRKGKSILEKIPNRVSDLAFACSWHDAHLGSKVGTPDPFTDPVPQRPRLLPGEEPGLCEDLPDGGRLAGQGLV